LTLGPIETELFHFQNVPDNPTYEIFENLHLKFLIKGPKLGKSTLKLNLVLRILLKPSLVRKKRSSFGLVVIFANFFVFFRAGIRNLLKFASGPAAGTGRSATPSGRTSTAPTSASFLTAGWFSLSIRRIFFLST